MGEEECCSVALSLGEVLKFSLFVMLSTLFCLVYFSIPINPEAKFGSNPAGLKSCLTHLCAALVPPDQSTGGYSSFCYYSYLCWFR